MTKPKAQATTPSTGIKFTIPDVPKKKQIEMIKSMREVVEAMAQLTGEEVDLTPFDEAIRKVQNEN